MSMPKIFKILCICLLITIMSVSSLIAANNPTLLLDQSLPRDTTFSGAIGPILNYKRISGPYDFGGDMLVWGVRGFFGKNNDPKLGVLYQTGSLTGTGFKFNMDMGGLSLEDSFREDPRVKWRVSFGGGKYKMSSRNSGFIVNQGSFTFVEPMVIGLLPATRNIMLEFGVGYTFADTTGVRIEGFALQAEALLGKF